jgi:beta-xylosidase
MAGNTAPAGGAGGSATPAAGSGGANGCQLPLPGSHGKNPLFSDQYTADPGALVHDCTFYVQCGHDEGQTGFVMKEWFLLSSTDMVHWTKNVALKLTDFKWADANAWAGQMVTKGGKFYWYVPVEERGGGMALAIAVADSPTGPFKDALGKPLVNDAFEMSNMGFKTPSDTPYTIDPTVFVEDDGHAYLHYGGFGRMIVAKLSDDMLSIDGKMQEVTPKGFFEAAFLTKRDGKYYEIYAAGQNPATIDYATSTSPLGPWKYGGRVLDALPSLPGQDAATNHSGVAEFAGQWYIVYHLSNGPNGGGTYKREVAVDKLNFAADGTIQKVTPSAGLSF